MQSDPPQPPLVLRHRLAGHFPDGLRAVCTSVMKTKRGFTLIELLVVIAIISLLVSILLPSLNRAKELGRDVVCRSNLRNLGMTVQLYATDYDGFGPPAYTGGNRWEYLYWNNRMTTTEYLDPGLLECPSASGDPKKPNNNQFDGTNRQYDNIMCYSINDYITGYKDVHGGRSPDPAGGTALERVSDPDQRVLCQPGFNFSDGITYVFDAQFPFTTFRFWYENVETSNSVAFRHLGNANVVMLAGHVENLSPIELVRGFDNFRKYWHIWPENAAGSGYDYPAWTGGGDFPR